MYAHQPYTDLLYKCIESASVAPLHHMHGLRLNQRLPLHVMYGFHAPIIKICRSRLSQRLSLHCTFMHGLRLNQRMPLHVMHGFQWPCTGVRSTWLHFWDIHTYTPCTHTLSQRLPLHTSRAEILSQRLPLHVTYLFSWVMPCATHVAHHTRQALVALLFNMYGFHWTARDALLMSPWCSHVGLCG